MSYRFMRNRFVLSTIFLAMLFSCSSKKLTLNENPNPSSSDFINAFPTVNLPFELQDGVLEKKQNDSFFVNYRTFTKFFPDSTLVRHFGKMSRPKLYLLGKNQQGKNEYYLFFNAITPEKKIAFVTCFTRDRKFSAARVLFAQQDDGYHASALLDSRYTIIITHQHKNENGEILYRKDDYMYSEPGKFMFILTESNEPSQKSQAIIDPIDTLARRHIYSGDYLQDKRNIVAVRDLGKDASRFVFFIHFEKDNGECKGELKGSAKFINSYIAQYHSNNDPCGIQFSFKENAVFIKEISACGSHRDIKCFFEGLYKKKKEPKKKSGKKTK